MIGLTPSVAYLQRIMWFLETVAVERRRGKEVKMANVLILSRAEMSTLVPTTAAGGHRVIEAYDSRQLLQIALNNRVDIVMLPADAEPVDGEELSTLIRRITSASIAVAGQAGETRMLTALSHGAHAYIPFPIDPDTHRTRIRSLSRRGPETVLLPLVPSHHPRERNVPENSPTSMSLGIS